MHKQDLIEEKHPNTGVVVRTYIRGKMIGKVFYFRNYLFREDSLSVMNSLLQIIIKSLQSKLSRKLHSLEARLGKKYIIFYYVA